MSELFVEDRKLVSEEKWKQIVDDIKKQQATIELPDALVNAIKKRIPFEHFGIFFSGGVDSSFIALICKKQKANFTCYCIGTEDSDDLREAKIVAEHFGFNLKTKVLSHEEIEEICKKVIKITGKKDAVTVGVAAVEYAACELARQDNVKILFGGLGSEEIFAGYQRHKNSDDVNKECWNGLQNAIWQRDFTRDFAIATHFRVEFRTPFLDKEVILAAMQIPADQKIHLETNKWILRNIADGLGLGKYAWRKKQAAQYGSHIDKSIEKLTKQRGFKFKKEYLESLS
ncbi:MAG: asparagine synthase C-terminal domain-containing protein [Candidatus Woesearchaeota archaeon]